LAVAPRRHRAGGLGLSFFLSLLRRLIEIKATSGSLST
jgi:hypothetical protein